MKTILVTGGAGFIGSNFVEVALSQGYRVVVLDALTYAGHLENLDFPLMEESKKISLYKFTHGNIRDRDLVENVLKQEAVDWVINFAAESHVDKSIDGPAPFIETNIDGTFQMLTASKKYFDTLTLSQKEKFRYLQVSTDEVFGSLGTEGKFHESYPYQPRSPYSASKAASDHLTRAWGHTFGLPTIVTNCSNNYGPRQFPEKLIPHMILSALSEKALPVYGDGKNIRDWIHVKDHARGILKALETGEIGDTYCFGGNSERTNLDVVHSICDLLDELKPLSNQNTYRTQIKFVTDRPGHDFRYAIDDGYAQRKLGYRREYTDFEMGLKQTIQWYLANMDWCQKVLAKPGAKVSYDWSMLQSKNDS